jgi:hypothetical protein
MSGNNKIEEKKFEFSNAPPTYFFNQFNKDLESLKMMFEEDF